MSVKTNLIRAKDLNFLCVCSPGNITGGATGQGVVGSGSNMGLAFQRCKRTADKTPGSKGSKDPVYIVYASESEDIHVDASGHVQASKPVLRLTKLNKEGRVYSK